MSPPRAYAHIRRESVQFFLSFFVTMPFVVLLLISRSFRAPADNASKTSSKLIPSRHDNPLDRPAPLGDRQTDKPRPQTIQLADANVEHFAGEGDPRAQHHLVGAPDEADFGGDCFGEG